MKQAAQGVVTVTREHSELGNWTVRHWGKGQFSNRMLSSNSFLERDEAIAFARRLQREHGAGDVLVK
ncbi:MAG: hypothetical protein AABY75_07595 [Bacteroidota bacterium]